MSTIASKQTVTNIILDEVFAPEYLQSLSEDDLDKLELYAKTYCTDIWSQKTIDKCLANDGTLVTIVCITYNHEDYIAQALQSFVDQVTDFKFKVLVGDDVSTDRTPEIIRSFAQRYPNIIVPVIREENLGANRNLIDLAERADSPFIAFCEGDDYWIENKKLQTQYDYMIENPELRACFAETAIDAPEDWYLNDYYKPICYGVRCIPGSIPGFNANKETYTAREYIPTGPAHTSSMFFRWDYGLEVPECYYEQASGDHSIMMMQIGIGQVGYIRQIMSAYRRSDVGVTMFKSKDDHFLKTRTDWIEVLQNLRDFFIEHYDGYAVPDIENRMKKEALNYLDILVRVGDGERIGNFFRDYPGAITALDAYLSYYKDGRALTNTLSWNGYKYMVRNAGNRRKIKTLMNVLWIQTRRKNAVSRRKINLQRRKAIINYWLRSKSSIEKNLWVFSGFNGTTYGDNTKYLFEFICKNHPEINAVWMTKSTDIYNTLKELELPVEMMSTSRAKELMECAEVAVIDHFVMSDFGRPRPLNPNTAVLQLWHGVGLKSMDNLGLTTVKGVRYLDEYDIDPNDSFLSRMGKHVRQFIEYPKAEQCENYAMMVVPGEEMKKAYESGFHLSENRFFVTGYPRMDRIIHETKNSPLPLNRKVLYAPTYRWLQYDEAKLIDELLNSIPTIEACLEKVDASLTIRLHPHTWRSYGQKIEYRIAEADCITIDDTKDIYECLDEYSILITDYSSIAYDFLLMDRPMVFLCPDLERYLERENNLNYDFEQFTPGTKATSWEEVTNAIQEYFADPKKDTDFRKSIRSFFYDDAALTGNSCEQIVIEMMRRLN